MDPAILVPVSRWVGVCTWERDGELSVAMDESGERVGEERRDDDEEMDQFESVSEVGWALSACQHQCRAHQKSPKAGRVRAG